MTNFDLLELIGKAEDKYIMESRRRPKKQSLLRTYLPQIVAACLILCVAGSAVGLGVKIGGTRMDSAAASSAPDSAVAEAALDAETPAEAPAAEAGAPTPGPSEKPVSAYDVTLLAAAQYPASIDEEDFEGLSNQWTENVVSDETYAAVNAFGYATVSRALLDGDTSGCFSPLSLYQALAILTDGAAGQTRDELLSLLGISDLDTLRDQAGRLYRRNYFDNDVDKLVISNSLWLDETASDGSPVSYDQQWVLSAAANYGSDVYQADFSAPDTAKALGAWIAEKTGGFLSPSPQSLNLSDDTLLAIVNTLWYKSQWQTEFDTEQTAPADFTTDSGETIQADFMHKTDEMGSYIETDEYTKSYLPLSNGRMIFVLPQEGVDVDSLLTEDKLWEVFENGDYSSAEVHWSIPKFETNVTYDLKDMLMDLGVTAAFDPVSADFSGISGTPLFVGTAQQGTHIALNEDGVEAAAYTILSLEEGAAEPEEEPKIVEMNLNRPFIYLITANDGSTLFIGVVRDPAN